MSSTNIHSLDDSVKIILYIWNQCIHSHNLLQDLSQLPKNLALRIQVIDIENVIDNSDFPPNLTCTPCLFILPTNNQKIRQPLVFNGRKSILLYCNIRSYDATNNTLTEDDALGKKQVETIFHKTFINESNDKNLNQIEKSKNFNFDLDKQQSSGIRNKLFDDFIDDPTLADDPRLNRKIADVKDLLNERGYS